MTIILAIVFVALTLRACEMGHREACGGSVICRCRVGFCKIVYFPIAAIALAILWPERHAWRAWALAVGVALASLLAALVWSHVAAHVYEPWWRVGFGRLKKRGFPSWPVPCIMRVSFTTRCTIPACSWPRAWSAYWGT